METCVSILEALDYWAQRAPSKIALTFLDDAGAEIDALTYSQILQRSNSLAAHLLSDSSKLGLTKGSTCLLVYPPSLDFTVAYLACLRAGVIAVPCFPPDPKRLKKDLDMFRAIQGSSGATVALTSRTYNYAKKVRKPGPVGARDLYFHTCCSFGWCGAVVLRATGHRRISHFAPANQQVVVHYEYYNTVIL